LGFKRLIAERCKKSGVIPEIIDGMSAYKDRWASEKKIIPILLFLRFCLKSYPQAMCRATDAIKPSEMNVSDLRSSECER